MNPIEQPTAIAEDQIPAASPLEASMQALSLALQDFNNPKINAGEARAGVQRSRDLMRANLDRLFKPTDDWPDDAHELIRRAATVLTAPASKAFPQRSEIVQGEDGGSHVNRKRTIK